MRGAGRIWRSLAVLLLLTGAAVSPRASRTFQGPPMDANVFRTIARQQSPAVVAIVTTTWRDAASPEDAEWLEYLAGGEPVRPDGKTHGEGDDTRAHPGVAPQRVGVLGFSQGGVLSLLIAAYDGGAGAVVAD